MEEVFFLLCYIGLLPESPEGGFDNLCKVGFCAGAGEYLACSAQAGGLEQCGLDKLMEVILAIVSESYEP